MQDIRSCYTPVEVPAGTEPVTPARTDYVTNKTQSVLATQMLGKMKGSKCEPQEQDVVIQMFTPLQSFNSLIPSGLDIQWRINFTDDKRYFITQTTGVKPTFQITGHYHSEYKWEAVKTKKVVHNKK